MKALLALLLPFSACAGNVTLNWKASPAPGKAYVVHFGICREGFPPVYRWKVNAGTNLTATIRGLKDDTLYYFSVTSNIAGKESAYSNEIVVRTDILLLPPTDLRGTFSPSCKPNNTHRGVR